MMVATTVVMGWTREAVLRRVSGDIIKFSVAPFCLISGPHCFASRLVLDGPMRDENHYLIEVVM